MEDFMSYMSLGFEHVLDVAAYDHILFLIALVIPFTFTHIRKVVLLVSLFTLGHTISLCLSVFKLLTFAPGIIEFLIPVTIFFTAMYNLFVVILSRKNSKWSLHLFAAFFFGLIHGFGFSNYFKMIIYGLEKKALPLLSFAIGIEISQLLIVLLMLLLSTIFLKFIKVPSKYWVIFHSLVVIFITIPMLINTFPWEN